jgi:hypothetical protein
VCNRQNQENNESDLLSYNGKRISESLSVKFEDIDFKQKAFRLYQSKVKTEQWLPLHKFFLHELPIAGAINKTGNIFQGYSIDHLNRVMNYPAASCEVSWLKKPKLLTV